MGILRQAMEYMDGDFTVSADKMNLIDASVALYYMVSLSGKQGTLNSTVKQVAQLRPAPKKRRHAKQRLPR
jgi:hypothetical protein